MQNNGSNNFWEDNFKPYFTVNECYKILEFKDDLSLSTDSSINCDINEDCKSINQDCKLVSLKAISLSEGNISVCGKFRDISCQTIDCLWDRKELNIIRSAVKDLNRQKRKLLASEEQLKGRNIQLEAQLVEISDKLKKVKKKLSETVKANERFAIMTRVLETGLDSEKNQNKLVMESNQRLNEELKESKQEIHNLNSQLFDQNQIIKKNQMKFDRISQETQHQVQQSLQKHQLASKQSMTQLQQQIDHLTQALSQEKINHKATECSIKQLMRHFPSHPNQNDIPHHDPVNMKTINYTS